MNQPFKALPPVTKYLLIINAIMLLVLYLPAMGVPNFNIDHTLSFHYFKSDLFRPHQFITYMFLHGGFMHLLGNMLAVFIFGSVLENYWGSKRFLTYYLLTGIGAAIVHAAVQHYEWSGLNNAVDIFLAEPTPDGYLRMFNEHFQNWYSLPTEKGTSVYNEVQAFVSEWKANAGNPELNPTYIGQAIQDINYIYSIQISGATVGASGAVFGILAAYGMLFPNHEMVLMFFPIPLKAKYFVLLYAAGELYLAIENNPKDDVAHFAHLGGALFGFIIVMIWSRKKSHFN